MSGENPIPERLQSIAAIKVETLRWAIDHAGNFDGEDWFISVDDLQEEIDRIEREAKES